MRPFRTFSWDSQTNTLLGSAELTVAAPSGWQHRLTASDYFYRYNDNSPEGNTYNFASLYDEHVNHMALEYQGDYSERAGRTQPWDIASKTKTH